MGLAFHIFSIKEKYNYGIKTIKQGPVVQSIVSLTSSLMVKFDCVGALMVKMLTVLVSTISNSQVFLLEKCE